MALRDRYITFDGTNLKTAYGLQYSSFEEELPEPKIIKVDIPAGLDLDITDALGVVGYHNGTHTLKFLLYGDTQAERLERKQAIIAKLHGKRASYTLSWDSGYTYTGRAKVSVEHLFDNADLLTVEIDRSPWKTRTRESVDLNAHPSATYTLEGSTRYHTVQAILRQSGMTKVGSDAVVERAAAGTYTLATDLYGNTVLTFTVNDWLMYVDEPNLVVNESRISYSGTDAVIDADYTVNGTDMVFADEANQHVTVRFYRWDL
jgi:hypothetical protein